jgi:hypothetical protein
LSSDGVPRSFWGLTLDQLGAYVRQRVAVGLGDVEDVLDFPAVQLATSVLIVDVHQVLGLVEVRLVTSIGDGGQDGDSSFSAANLTAQALPCPVPGHAGCVGLLLKDQQAVSP